MAPDLGRTEGENPLVAELEALKGEMEQLQAESLRERADLDNETAVFGRGAYTFRIVEVYLVVTLMYLVTGYAILLLLVTYVPAISTWLPRLSVLCAVDSSTCQVLVDRPL